MLRGALAAAVTPLREDGTALDEEAFAPYLDFLAARGLDGVLALGTTGEGILLSADERRRAAELFIAGPLPVIVHCGAQTTAETVTLARDAAERGAVAGVVGRAGLAAGARGTADNGADGGELSDKSRQGRSQKASRTDGRRDSLARWRARLQTFRTIPTC